MAERDFPDGRMQKLMGKPWNSWNLPEQPTDLDLRKLRDSFQPPEQFRVPHQSTPLTARSMPLYGTHPDSDFLSITKCPACGWLLKIQHANRHFLRDSRGAIVCKDSDLAIFESKVLGKAYHPLAELKDSYTKKITLRLVATSYAAQKPVHSLRSVPLMNEIEKKSRHSSSKTDYLSHSSHRSRSHTQVSAPPSSPYSSKSRSGSSTASNTGTHHSSMSLNSSSSKGKSGKSHSTSSSTSWSSASLRSSTNTSSKSSGAPKTNQGSYTLSIPSEDMGMNESVEDLLMPNVTHTFGSSKQTVHIIATSNSSKSKTATADRAADYDHHHVKFFNPEVPEKRLKLDSSHSHSSDHYHKSSSLSHNSSNDSHSGGHDSFSKSKPKYSSSLINGTVSSHGNSDSSKSKNKLSSTSSSSSHAKNDSGSSSKHHLRSTGPSIVVTPSKPIVSVAGLTSSSSQSKSHHLGNITTTTSSSSVDKDKDRDKDRTSSAKKKKRKRDKDEPRKIIPLKDRDFNPDKHCGVCVPGNAIPCKRSLTCKTHSMALRRAVTGRSQSFDALLAAHKLAKTEEKKSQTKDVVEEIAPPKPKKKKLSGTSSTIIGSSPNDLGTLVGAVEPTSYGLPKSKSPDIEVIKTIAKAPKPVVEINNIKILKPCPIVYPYKRQDLQDRFAKFWENPTTLERNKQMTVDEKNKFTFLLKHYKNPYYSNSPDAIRYISKTPREKRNVFSNWNPSEKAIGCSQLGKEAENNCHASETDDIQVLREVSNKK